MIRPRELETSGQQISAMPAEMEPLAPSDPLHMLAEHAPAVPEEVDLREVHFPFSNDDTASSYDQLRSRTMLPEYREATNRTAIVVGEASLMAALRFIPEETLILLDKSPDMCAYMSRYVTALRECDTFDDWGDRMGFRGENTGRGTGVPRAMGYLKEQAVEWMHAGYGHPASEEDLYVEAQTLAQQKAIVPWQADLGNRRDMKRLGKVLKAHEAHLTMINLTNAAADVEVAVKDAGQYAKRLGHLPVTSEAPIMASSYIAKPPIRPDVKGNTVEPVGPFFGLENLAEHGETSVLESHVFDAHKDMAALAILSALLSAMPQDARHDGNGMGLRNGIISLGPEGVNVMDLSDLPSDIRAIVENFES